MKNMFYFAGLVLLTLLVSCSSNDNPVTPSNSVLNGTWTYSMQSTDTLSISVTLSENDGQVTGSYDYTLVDVTVSGTTTFTVTSHQVNSDLTGTYGKGAVTLSFGEFRFTGNLSSDNTTITGTASFNDGQNRSSYAVVLQKK